MHGQVTLTPPAQGNHADLIEDTIASRSEYWAKGKHRVLDVVFESSDRDWLFDRSVWLHPNIGLYGTSRQQRRGHVNFRWAEGVRHAYFFRQTDHQGNGVYNDNFDTIVQQLTLIGGGLNAGGAQMSEFNRLQIFNHPKAAILLGKGSRNLTISNCKFDGNQEHPDDVPGQPKSRGESGISSHRSDGIVLINNGYQWNKAGIDLRTCSGWSGLGQRFENCETAIRMEGDCFGNQIQVVLEQIQDVVFDFRKLKGGADHRGNRFYGIIAKTPNPTWYPPGSSEPESLKPHIVGNPNGQKWAYLNLWV